MKHYTTIGPVEPNASILHCALCGVEIYRTLPDDVTDSAWLSKVEGACAAHLVDRHPFRYRLWLRFQWKWLVRGLVP